MESTFPGQLGAAQGVQELRHALTVTIFLAACAKAVIGAFASLLDLGAGAARHLGVRPLPSGKTFRFAGMAA